MTLRLKCFSLINFQFVKVNWIQAISILFFLSHCKAKKFLENLIETSRISELLAFSLLLPKYIRLIPAPSVFLLNSSEGFFFVHSTWKSAFVLFESSSLLWIKSWNYTTCYDPRFFGYVGWYSSFCESHGISHIQPPEFLSSWLFAPSIPLCMRSSPVPSSLSHKGTDSSSPCLQLLRWFIRATVATKHFRYLKWRYSPI